MDKKQIGRILSTLSKFNNRKGYSDLKLSSRGRWSVVKSVKAGKVYHVSLCGKGQLGLRD